MKNIIKPRLLERYRDEIVKAMMEKRGYKNRLEVPRLQKIIINVGMGQASQQDIAILERAVEEIALVAGQRPVITRAKKAISNFKIRKGSPVGCRVTLRGYRMYEFLDRFISIALPRVRDFRGLAPSAFDENGNYSMGLTEQSIFPEVDQDKIKKIYGMNIVIVTSAKNKDDAFDLLKFLGLPFAAKT